MALPREPNRLILPVSDRDHCQGRSTANVTLVEYGDYQCPRCGAAQHIIPYIQQQLGEQLRFVFRHFPQLHLHPESYHAAEAVEAAASQNKFWEMHAYLLTYQSKLADSYLVEYAIALDLDINQFLSEMTSDCHMPRVNTDIENGIQSGVNKTPTFFINGFKHNDNQSLGALIEAIVQAGDGV
jgi:protein-disulfide isomerase